MASKKRITKTICFNQPQFIVILFILTLAFYYSYAQDTSPDLLQNLQEQHNDTLKLKYSIEETFPPEFPGGNVALQKFLGKSIRWKKGMKNGKVVVAFTMSPEGYLEKAKIIHRISPLDDAEVLRVLNTMPKWVPVSKVFKTVSGDFVLPVSFLDDRTLKPPLSNSHPL